MYWFAAVANLLLSFLGLIVLHRLSLFLSSQFLIPTYVLDFWTSPVTGLKLDYMEKK